MLCNVDMAIFCLLASWPNFVPCSYLISRIDAAGDADENEAMENH